MTKTQNTKARELILFREFKSGNEKAFDYFFERYYQGLCVFASRITGSEQSAKDIVQDFFTRFWENREKLEIHSAVKSYFIRSVHNRCLDYLAFREIRLRHASRELALLSDDDLLDYPLLDPELQQQLDKAIGQLPETVRKTFLLSRMEGLSYKHISEREQISVKAVEYRISKALTFLRKALDDFLFFLIL
ncbi:MAG: RNA polymerase sigma-70 factor [Mangrovibacterium sp.]